MLLLEVRGEEPQHYKSVSKKESPLEVGGPQCLLGNALRTHLRRANVKGHTESVSVSAARQPRLQK